MQPILIPLKSETIRLGSDCGLGREPDTEICELCSVILLRTSCWHVGRCQQGIAHQRFVHRMDSHTLYSLLPEGQVSEVTNDCEETSLLGPMKDSDAIFRPPVTSC